MPESIRDGKGRGFLAAVSEENRLLSHAVSISQRAHQSSAHGQSYTFNTSVLTLSATDTWHWVAWWNVTSTTHNMYIEEIGVDWNGGSTNFNRPLQVRNLPLTGAPTGNHTLTTASNNNKLSKNTAGLVVYKWDGVGAGMTTATGPAGGDSFHAQGHSFKDFRGFVINGLNESVGIQVKSPEVGDFSIGLGVYFIVKGADI